MYASQAWHCTTRIYGDGECFLFRLSPDPIAYHWVPDETISKLNKNQSEAHIEIDTTIKTENESLTNRNSNECDIEIHNQLEHEALMKHFMISRDHFISMGGNPNGGSGLRLNDDLTVGNSSFATGFNNEPLPGNGLSTFDVGLVEVYRFIREVDGKAVDGGDVWNFDLE